MAVVNGAALSLFGLVQFFTSPANVIYWTDQTRGAVFGPFINRDHFAFYVNLCIGLGIGLLVSRSMTRDTARVPIETRATADPAPQPRRRSTGAGLLHDPAALWISFALRHGHRRGLLPVARSRAGAACRGLHVPGDPGAACRQAVASRNVLPGAERGTGLAYLVWAGAYRGPAGNAVARASAARPPHCCHPGVIARGRRFPSLGHGRRHVFPDRAALPHNRPGRRLGVRTRP